MTENNRTCEEAQDGKTVAVDASLLTSCMYIKMQPFVGFLIREKQERWKAEEGGRSMSELTDCL